MSIKKKGIIIAVVVAVVVVTTIAAGSILIEKFGEADEPVKTVLVSTDAEGKETLIEDRNMNGLADWEQVAKNLAKCVGLEENIDYETYTGKEASKYYSKRYNEIRERENAERKKDLQISRIKKFSHSFLLMSLNFIEETGDAIATAFYADVITDHKGTRFAEKYGYSQRGEAERYIQYRLIEEAGNWVIDEERIIQ